MVLLRRERLEKVFSACECKRRNGEEGCQMLSSLVTRQHQCGRVIAEGEKGGGGRSHFFSFEKFGEKKGAAARGSTAREPKKVEN